METITWTASNNSSFLNGNREAKTVLGAVRAMRNYIENELCGEGSGTIFVDGVEFRQDRKDIFTGYKWNHVIL